MAEKKIRITKRKLVAENRCKTTVREVQPKMDSMTKYDLYMKRNQLMRKASTIKNCGYVRGKIKNFYDGIENASDMEAWKVGRCRKYATSRQRMNLNDFEILNDLCSGSHGAVSLVRYKRTQAIYAMKRIPTSTSLSVSYIIDERNTMIKMNGTKGVVQLYFAFIDDQNIHFVMDFAQGGDFFDLICAQRRFSENMTKYYVAQLIEVLERLHNQNVAHRDLKLENMFWDENGHLLLGDFGVVKDLEAEIQRIRTSSLEDVSVEDLEELLQRAKRESKKERAVSEINALLMKKKGNHHSIAGSYDTMAPEVFHRTGAFSTARDWWSVGIIIYLLMFGCYPFGSEQPDELMHQILKFKQTFGYPRNAVVSPELRDLLENYLICDQSKRVGGSKTIAQLKKHPWFSEIAWGSLRSVPSPYLHLMKKVTGYDERVHKLLNMKPAPIVDRSRRVLRKRRPIDFLLRGSFEYIHPDLHLQSPSKSCPTPSSPIMIVDYKSSQKAPIQFSLTS